MLPFPITQHRGESRVVEEDEFCPGCVELDTFGTVPIDKESGLRLWKDGIGQEDV